MHWFLGVSQPVSANYVWLPTLINILLTAAIAWAGYRQYVVSHNLLKLQAAIEKHKSKVSLYLRIKHEPPTQPQMIGGAILEITNLSPFGIWLENLSVFIAEDNTKTVQLERLLAAGQMFQFQLRGVLVELCGFKPSQQARSAVAWVKVNYATSERAETAQTERYSMKIMGFEVNSLFLEKGKSLENRS